ncbi:peptidoglycan editing factor PgeF [Alteromonadaceae bacterium BrNp21-10]|nr:peptidoglycan editing factor PgeF [Alteromonadaceae bacterium BrNp21-10]
MNGVSLPPYAGLNLGAHVGDNPLHVQYNRQQLPNASDIRWLNQTHSSNVIEINSQTPLQIESPTDASISREAHVACAVMTADCLPVLIAAPKEKVVAAVHAGWRGLAAGIIEKTISQMNANPEQLYVWLGPAISAKAFEVGAEVLPFFKQQEQACFVATTQHKFMADLYAIARHRLISIGVKQVSGGEYCTYAQPELFYSYRRDGQTGRMLSCISLC